MSDVPPPGWDGPPPPPQPFGEQPAAGAPPFRAAPPPPPGWLPGAAPPPPSGYVPFNPYGPYGAGNQRVHPRGTIVMVFGILGLCGLACGVLYPFGIAAWVMGQKAMNQINADPTTEYTNRGQVSAGRVCGIIATCIMAVIVALVVIAVAVSPD